MGGAGSEISDATTDVFLECAYFDPAGVRTTSKRLGLSTESSYRFERGVDSESALLQAIDTAAEMLRQYANGTVVSGRIDVYPAPVQRPTLRLRPSRAQRLLGVSMKKADLVATLSSLQFACTDSGDDAIDCVAPAFRHDIFVEADLIEEAGRFYGYDNIAAASRAKVSLSKTPSIMESRLDAIRSSLACAGLFEIVTNSLTSEKKNRAANPEVAPVVLLNPLSPDMAQLRVSMLPSSLEAIAHNINRRNLDNRFFDIGRTYHKASGEALPVERDILAVVLNGNFFSTAWNCTTGIQSDFFIVKGLLEKLIADIGAGGFVYKNAPETHPYFGLESCVVSCAAGIVGSAGRVRDDVCAAFDIKEPVYFAELDITDFLTAKLPPVTFSQLPKFPAVQRDFCFVFGHAVAASDIAAEIRPLSPLVEDVTPFDVYRGEKLGPGQVSIAFSVRLRSGDRTLTDKEAETVCQAVVSTMESKFAATLRK
jgi:phenylalanyl-tRNA synthetase beta chain